MLLVRRAGVERLETWMVESASVLPEEELELERPSVDGLLDEGRLRLVPRLELEREDRSVKVGLLLEEVVLRLAGTEGAGLELVVRGLALLRDELLLRGAGEVTARGVE
jgi:hypothetical protein